MVKTQQKVTGSKFVTGIDHAPVDFIVFEL